MSSPRREVSRREVSRREVSRREVLGGIAGGVVGGIAVGLSGGVIGGLGLGLTAWPASAAGTAARAQPSTPVGKALARYGATLHLRAEWASNLPVPSQPLPLEPVVQALVVHHTVTSNTYGSDGTPAQLRSIYRWHTGTTGGAKGWPDIAYSFFVDRFGAIWEGRTGSASHAVAGSATGGNQGSTRLCSLLGDFTTTAPSPAMAASLATLLAALSDLHGLDPSGTATFTSRGSNRFPRGAQVRIPVIAGHREVSLTSCPGDAAYALIGSGDIARAVEVSRRTAASP